MTLGIWLDDVDWIHSLRTPEQQAIADADYERAVFEIEVRDQVGYDAFKALTEAELDELWAAEQAHSG